MPRELPDIILFANISFADLLLLLFLCMKETLLILSSVEGRDFKKDVFMGKKNY